MTADLLRIATAGSVDDGKSTLIGRLLYDTKQILVDQLEHIEETSKRRGDGYVNLALLTDGLRAEREQGITIDVAYRSFVTARRRFQLATGGADGRRLGLDRGQLVLVEQVGVVQQPADEGRLAVVDRAGGGEAQELVGRDGGH